MLFRSWITGAVSGWTLNPAAVQASQTFSIARPAFSTAGIVGLWVFVCLCAIAVGAFFGSASSMLHYNFLDGDKPVVHGLSLGEHGAIWGGVFGLAAGLAWCRLVLPRKSCPPRKFGFYVLAGLGWGAAVGTACGLMVHAALCLLTSRLIPGSFLAGLIFGVGAGVVLGVISGLICGAVLNWFCPPRVAPPSGNTT